MVPDKNREFADVVLGCSTIDEYLKPDAKYFGASIGRYGNRIKIGKFPLEGTTYLLVKNNGKTIFMGVLGVLSQWSVKSNTAVTKF